MSFTQYRVVLTGVLNPGVTQEQAIEAIAQLFNTQPERVSQAFTQAPIAIKKDVDLPTAQRIQNALSQSGVMVDIQTMEGEAVSSGQPQEVSIKGDQQTSKGSDELQRYDMPGLQFSIEGRPDYAFLTVQLPKNETLKVEASAMATMDTHIVMKTKIKGGLGRLLTSESLFINEFTAENGPGEMGIAPGTPGDLAHVHLNNETIYLQNSAFVASSSSVITETKWQGLAKGFFSGESLFLIRCSGNGDLWFNTYGGIIMLDVDGDYVVDTGNIVAFTEGLDYDITKVGGYKSLFFSGEGFVCRFKGKGKVWIQTRNVGAFLHWVEPFRPVESSSSDD